MIVNCYPVTSERLETLVLARLSGYARPPAEAALAQALQRYAPTTLGGSQWRDLVSHVVHGLQDRRLVTAERRPARDNELKRRVGAHTATRWQQWSDHVLPALALGVAADDSRSHARLARPGGWSAAIAGRALHLWAEGPPPSLMALCDALTWRELGLSGTPKGCPAAVRSHFLRKHVAAAPGPPERLLRLLAAQAVDAPSSELDALRAGLVRIWLSGHELAAPAAAETSSRAPRPRTPPLIAAVR